MKGSLIIVGFFLLGIIVGLYHIIPQSFLDSGVSYYALCCLMFCVGISIGCDTTILKSFKKVNPRLMLLPVMTILGTLAGCAAVSVLLGHRQLTDCLAIGSGFGYYSLSSIFITEYRGAELGTIALLANICRDPNPAVRSPAGQVFRQAGAHQRGRRHHHGHHVAHHHTRLGREVYHRIHLPRVLRRFLGALPGDVLLLALTPPHHSQRQKPNIYHNL